nr:MAG TPA: hypothetical protein [Caudoviricetes sp.]
MFSLLAKSRLQKYSFFHTFLERGIMRYVQAI